MPPGLNSDGSAGSVGSGVAARSEAARAARTAGGVAISRQGGSSASSAAARAARFFSLHSLLLRLEFCPSSRRHPAGRDTADRRRLDVTSCGHRRRRGARLGVVVGRRRAGRERVDVRRPHVQSGGGEGLSKMILVVAPVAVEQSIQLLRRGGELDELVPCCAAPV